MRARTMGLDFDFSRLSNRNHVSGNPNASSAPQSTAFAFRAGPPPAPLKFSCHPNTTPSSLMSLSNDARFKRKRNCEEHPGPIRKKRRLRLTLITSRLSRPFAVPTTHIVDRGRSRIAVWAKQKALGRNLLRKAAILNRVQCRVEAAIAVSPNMAAGRQDEIELLRRKGVEMTHLARLRGSLATVNSTRPVGIPEAVDAVESSVATRATTTAIAEVPRCSPNFRTGGVDGRRDYTPSPPSPLGQSNYDALDLEEVSEVDLSADRHPDADDEGDARDDEDAYFDSLIFGVAAAAPSTDDSVFVSQYDRLDYLDANHSSSIFSASAAAPITASEDEVSADGASLFDRLTEISSADPAALPATSPPSSASVEIPSKPKRPKGWNPNFASAPAPLSKPQQLRVEEEKEEDEERRDTASPQSDDRLAEIMREKERQRQVLFLNLPSPC